MNKFLVQVLLVVVSFGSLATAQTSVSQTTTVCFINAQRVLAAHPMGAKVIEAQQKAQAELKGLSDKIQELQVKVANGTATTAEKQQYEVLVKTAQARQAQLKTQIDKLLEPITRDVDVAVSKVAIARGCAVVLDRAIAAQSGLVVFVNPNTSFDISDDIILEITKPK